MKRILLLTVLILTNLLSFAQYPNKTGRSNDKTRDTVPGGLKGNLIMYWYADTSVANAVPYLKGEPDIMIKTGGDLTWQRSHDAKRWVLIGGSICAGTQLISGSITWSGSGLVYDATDLDYYILCSRYFANSTTLTLSVADPTFARIDKFYADITGAIGVITGTPSTNPQEPQVNPLTQIDLGFVYIPAGSTVPAGTTQTVIYNENVEWTGTSDVPSINFAYATNPYIGSLSTYLPSAPNSSYVEWQSNGIDYLFSEAQYLKFWVRLNDNFVSEPLSFLDVTFEYTDVTVSQTLAVGNGDFNMDYSLINQWQLVSIPLTGITTYGAAFNEVHFVINSAPSSFQLDYVYLLETATVPPAPVGGTWLLNGNSAINDVTKYIGTRDAKKLNFGTNGQIRAYIDTAGIELLIDDTTANVILIDSNGKIWKTYQPTILADSPLVIYTDVYQDRIKADTTRRGAALATQYYADSVANAGGGTPTWQQTLTAGSVLTTNNTVTSPTGRRLSMSTVGSASNYSQTILDTTQITLIHYDASGQFANSLSLSDGGLEVQESDNLNERNSFLQINPEYHILRSDSGFTLTEYNELKINNTDSGVIIRSDLGTYNMPRTTPTTGQVLTSTAGAVLGWATPSSSSPSGNYGNLQINRNGVFSTPASDSLTFSSATLAVKGALTTTGAITATGNVSGNNGLFTSGVRLNNNTNIYWNSGPVILGNTNDITLKNATATAGANVSIGTSAAVASAILDVNSTTKGALLPRMTGSEAEAISSPATGLIIYCTNGNGSVITSVGLWNYNGTAWVTAGAKDYKVLVGNLTQAGTSAPSLTVFQNTTGTTFTMGYNSPGIYSLTANSGTPFTSNKTQVIIGSNINAIGSDVYTMNTSINSTAVIDISSASLSTGFADNILTNTPIEIRIYP